MELGGIGRHMAHIVENELMRVEARGVTIRLLTAELQVCTVQGISH